MKKILKITTLFFLFLTSCDFSPKDYFPDIEGLKWIYSVSLESSYTGKNQIKRIMVTNVNVKKIGDITELSKLYSDGSYYSYKKENGGLQRTAVILAFSDGIDEPVKKVVYPDLLFNQSEWVVNEQLFFVKGFQPPLRNVKPSSKFDMTYKVKKKYEKFKVKGTFYYDCIEIVGTGSTDFIGDTRSGPIDVEIINMEILCNNIGLVKQVRKENTNASAFGNMKFVKELMSFN
tara:strand:- start:272 stop:967 length:696 start_codon:yes stop_codon:yes gene_type:complete